VRYHTFDIDKVLADDHDYATDLKKDGKHPPPWNGKGGEETQNLHERKTDGFHTISNIIVTLAVQREFNVDNYHYYSQEKSRNGNSRVSTWLGAPVTLSREITGHATESRCTCATKETVFAIGSIAGRILMKTRWVTSLIFELAHKLRVGCTQASRSERTRIEAFIGTLCPTKHRC
jgi:hypothetical protein